MNESKYYKVYKQRGVDFIASASELLIDQLMVNIENSSMYLMNDNLFIAGHHKNILKVNDLLTQRLKSK